MYPVPAARPHTCSLCDQSFVRRYNLERHRQTVHYDYTEDCGLKEKSEMDESIQSDHSESNTESSDVDTEEEDVDEGEESSSEESSSELEENTAFQEWYQQALDETKDTRDEKYQKYIDQSMDEEQAKEKAHAKTLWALQRIFFDKYTTHLWSSVHLQDDEIHQEILKDVEQRMNDRKDVYKILKRVLVKHRHKFDGLFLYDESDESEEDMDDENDA